MADDGLSGADKAGTSMAVLAAVAVLAVAVGAGAVLVLRSADGRGGAGAVASAGPTDVPMDGVEPDGGNHDDLPKALPVSSVRVGAGGTREVNGIPAGFPGTVEGAVAAATTYLSVLSTGVMFDPVERPDVLARIGDPQWLAAERAAVEARYQDRARELGLDPTGREPAGKVLLCAAYPARGAFRVAGKETSTARIEVWHYREQEVVPHGVLPRGGWQRTTVSLRRSGDDWKLAAVPSTVDGPAPLGTGRIVPGVDERAALLGGGDWQLYANTEGV
jgi:hypothetical protein